MAAAAACRRSCPYSENVSCIYGKILKDTSRRQSICKIVICASWKSLQIDEQLYE